MTLGHVDSAANGPSVFHAPGRMRPGDPITMTLADRSSRPFAADAARSHRDSTAVFARLVT